MKERSVLKNIVPYNAVNRVDNDLIYLNHNENLIGCSNKVLEELKNINTKEISNYPSYKKLNDKIQEKYDLGKNQFVITNGGDEAIRYVVDAFLEKGDKVVFTEPGFAMYNQYFALKEVEQVTVNLTIDYTFPYDEFNKNLKNCKLAIIINPYTPTGMELERNEIVKLLSENKDTLFLLDEAYTEFRKSSDMDLLSKYNNLIVLRSLSKAYGLAGLRLGFIAASVNLIEIINKVKAPYNVNSVAVNLGVVALNDWKFLRYSVNEVEKGREYLTEELSKLGFKVLPSKSNFVTFYSGKMCERIYNLLLNKGIVIKDISNMVKMENWYRITIGTNTQNQLLIETISKNIKLEAIIFDMDGVLVDVSNSYLKAIKETVNYFTKEDVSNSDVENLKNKGDFNCDWKLTEQLIKEKGYSVEFKKIKSVFQKFYLGSKNTKNGFINNEKWNVRLNVLKELQQKYLLAIVTDRPKEEAYIALKNGNAETFFKYVITRDDTDGVTKPNPLGLSMALDKLNVERAVYIGDNVDDMKAATRCKIPSIGLAFGNGNQLKTYGSFKNISRISTLVGYLG